MGRVSIPRVCRGIRSESDQPRPRGPEAAVTTDTIVRAIRTGIAVEPDDYGRPRPLQHVMLWQFYSGMSTSDAYALTDYIKRLNYTPHEVPEQPLLFGTDWQSASRQVFGEAPSPHDAQIFGHAP